MKPLGPGSRRPVPGSASTQAGVFCSAHFPLVAKPCPGDSREPYPGAWHGLSALRVGGSTHSQCPFRPLFLPRTRMEVLPGLVGKRLVNVFWG